MAATVAECLDPGFAIDHTLSSNATFCDAQHIALSGVVVFYGQWRLVEASIGFEVVGTALTLMMPCYEEPSDPSRRT